MEKRFKNVSEGLPPRKYPVDRTAANEKNTVCKFSQDETLLNSIPKFSLDNFNLFLILTCMKYYLYNQTKQGLKVEYYALPLPIFSGNFCLFIVTTGRNH